MSIYTSHLPVIAPADLPVGHDVEVEDSEIGDPDPNTRLICVFVL